MERLAECRVAVFGIGGVGGYVCEALARSGIGAFDLIDDDRICLTNINRQIIATRKTVGRYKADVMMERILEINPAAEITTHKCFFLPENASAFPFEKYDYVVDAIDTVTAKLELVLTAQRLEIPIISCMGAGNKLDPTAFRVADIYKTKVDPLARVMRRELKKRGVKKLKVVYSEEQPIRPIEDMAISCRSLSGGYLAYLRDTVSSDKQSSEIQPKAENSIRRKYHKQLFTPFAKACKQYQLIREGDHIAVCISGGKDSMLMAKLFQEIRTHRQVNFDLTFLVMDPGYNADNRSLIEHNARSLGIPITIFESSIFDAVDTVEKNPCYLCARMRRGYLYSKAKELGCNKIALGHHYDDVIETILMGMLHGGQVQTMMPKLHSTNFEGMELIRPMYLIREADICKWRDYNELHFLQCACHFTETCTTCHEDGTTSSKRLETKKLIAELKKTNPQVEANIFNSVSNVNLSTVIAYKEDGVKHHFLDSY